MQKYTKPIGRMLAVLALLALAQIPGGSVVGSTSGRDFVQCVQGCNATRKTCDNMCSTDCRALYPGTPNKALRDACILACKSICNTESDECKLMCQAIKNPPSPEAP